MSLTAVKTNKEIDMDSLLGYLEFHYIPDIKIHKNTLLNLFQNNNLSEDFLPDQIRPVDAFRRATATGQGHIQVTSSVSSEARLLVREVRSDSKGISRHLVRELIDSKNEVLEYITVGKMEYNRTFETMSTNMDLNYSGEYNYGQILNDIEQLYTEWTLYHTKDTVRTIIERVIKSMDPVSMMGRGKARFVPKTAFSELECLQGLIDDLGPYSVSATAGDIPYLHIIPLVDTVEQRDLITTQLGHETIKEVDSLMSNFAQVLIRNGSLKMEVVKRYALNIIEVRDKVETYEKLMSAKMSVLQSQLSSALTRIAQAPVEPETQDMYFANVS